MSDQEQPKVPISPAKFVNAVPIGNGLTLVLTFKVAPLVWRSNHADLSALVSTTIQAAAAAGGPPHQGPSMTAIPLQATAVGIARGRSPTDAILAIQVGPLTLSFATELGVLTSTLENLKKATVEAPPEKPN